MGFGELEAGGAWIVTHAGKSMFTPEGISIYSRKKVGLPEEVHEKVLDDLKQLEAENLRRF